MVDLPQLEDVHVAFGSSALCDACAQFALAGDDVRLAQRATTGWQDEPEAVPDLVKLLMAWAGHRMPPGPVTPEPHRHVEIRPLSAEDAATWRRLDPLMVDGPAHRVSVHGHISHTTDRETSVLEAFRDGDRSRLIGEDGRAWVISDGVTTWRMDDDGMVASPYDGETWAGQGLELASRRTRDDMDVFGFGTPIGPIKATVYLGRPAWSFRFAAPAHKPFDMAVIVDDETGFVLEQRYGDHSVDRWTSFDTSADMPDDLFTWTGPTRSRADIHAEREQKHEQDMAARAAWFADNVTPRPLHLAGEIAIVTLHDWHADGSFESSFDAGATGGSLARRRRDDSWWNLGWSDVSARWSDDTWDWALSL